MNKRNVVVIGGGTGLSYLVKGLKELPINLTCIITVADDGSSTGKLRKEFYIPAIGDIRKVLYNLSDFDEKIKSVMEYRFDTYSDLNKHALGNLLMTAYYKQSKSLSETIDKTSKLLNVKHKVLPVSEDYLTLVAEDINGHEIIGEENIGNVTNRINKIYYKENNIKVTNGVVEAITNADLIIFSMGSLYTSLLPNLILEDVQKAIYKAKAKVIYVCNAINEPSESYGYKVSDYLTAIHDALGFKKINAVISSNTTVSSEIIEKYIKSENKQLVKVDKKQIKEMGVELIEADLITTEDGTIKHRSVKLAVNIFNYLMR